MTPYPNQYSGSNPEPPRVYCGALPPEGIRRTASCLKPKGHEGEHRSMDDDRWPQEAPSTGSRP